jgi:hypothetical protein
LIANGSAQEKDAKKLVSAIDNISKKALYKGPTQQFFISRDLSIDIVQMNLHLIQVLNNLLNSKVTMTDEVELDKLRNYFLIKAAIAENI